jgi:hypothetical protein
LSRAINVEFREESVCVDALRSHQGEHRNDGRDLHVARSKEKPKLQKRQKEIRKVVKERGLDLRKRSGKGVRWQQLNADVMRLYKGV